MEPTLKDIGLEQCPADSCVIRNELVAGIVVHVDDLFAVTRNVSDATLSAMSDVLAWRMWSKFCRNRESDTL